MSSKGLWDGRNKHVHLKGFNKEIFNYLTARMKADSERVLMQKTFKFLRAKKRLNADLSVSNKRMRMTVQLLRVLNETELDRMRSTMGSVFAIGLTTPVPSLKAIKDDTTHQLRDTVPLMEHHQVRIVTCIAKDVDADANKERAPFPAVSLVAGNYDKSEAKKAIKKEKWARLCGFPGFDLEYLESATGVTDLHLNLKFKKLLGSSSTVRKAQRGGKHFPAARTGNVNISVGTYVRTNGLTYQIKSISEEDKRVKLVDVCGYDSEETAMEIEYDVATDLVYRHIIKQ